MNDIDISKAEDSILTILPNLAVFDGEITANGEFFIFDSIVINNIHTRDIDYVFTLFVAISSHTENQRLSYDPVSNILSALLTDFELTQKVEIGEVTQSYMNNLVVYEITLTVKSDEFLGYEL